jgi:hypothetical protein
MFNRVKSNSSVDGIEFKTSIGELLVEATEALVAIVKYGDTYSKNRAQETLNKMYEMVE